MLRPFALVGSLLLVTLGSGGGLQATETVARAAVPWDYWSDLSQLADLETTAQSGLRSSYCPDGCRFDRHSPTSSRFLRLEGDEGVLFESEGPGVITRIWMTSGEGVSQPLDPGATIRIYLDHAQQPIFEGPLPSLFDGSSPPFTLPLVGDRDRSSGGNFSYVPIPFAQHCKVTLEESAEANLWFQFNYQLLTSDGAVTSFRGDEDLSELRRLLSLRGSHPRPVPQQGRRVERSLSASNGQLLNLRGAGEITGLVLDLPRSAWKTTSLVATFDEQTTVDVVLADLFGQGPQGDAGTRSLLIGVDAQNRLYSFFPMPFFSSARLALKSPEPLPEGRVTLFVRDDPPPEGRGLFGAQLATSDGAVIGRPHPFLRVDHAGKWVGLASWLGSSGSRQYLEGDDRIYLDGDSKPTLHGTGTEDIFNAGFYFDQGPFGLALHGAPFDQPRPRSPRTLAYRLMLGDAISFERSIRAELEAGPTGDLALIARSVAYYYRPSEQQPTPEGEVAQD